MRIAVRSLVLSGGRRDQLRTRHKSLLWSGAGTLPRWEPHGVNTEQNSRFKSRACHRDPNLKRKSTEAVRPDAGLEWGKQWGLLVRENTNEFNRMTGESHHVIVSQESWVSFTGALLSRRETTMNNPRAGQAGTWRGSTKGEMPCKHDKTPHSLIIKGVWCLIYLCDNTKCEEVNSYTLRAVVNRKKPSDRYLTRYMLVILPERFAYFHLVTPTSRVSF